MIATVTLNPALDKTMAIRGFAIGATNRASIEQIDAGGKGINVAKAARQLGCPAIALGFLAGANGRWIADALQAMGIPCDFEWVPGETRVNLKIKDPLTGTETEINEPGFQVGADNLESLKRKIEEQAGLCSVMVFSGSLPPGVPPEIYAEFIRIARNRGAQTILDTAGAALKYGIAAGPDLIKPNRAEAEEVLGTRIDGEAALVGAARRLLELGARVVVLSLGADGALAVSPARAVASLFSLGHRCEQHRRGGRYGGRPGLRHDAGPGAGGRLAARHGRRSGHRRHQRISGRSRVH